MIFSNNHKKTNSGFTLIEISIVLVIIGLVAGGILVGRDLIHAAKVRKQITQIEQFNVAASAFRVKYDHLPGDLPADDAYELGFLDRSGIRGHGDGNGLIERCDPTDPSGIPQGCENSLFWADLADAKLIVGSFSLIEDADMNSHNMEETLEYLPEAVIVRDAILIKKDPISRMWLIFSGMNFLNPVGNNWNRKIPVESALAIDMKMDDGLPLSGRMTELFHDGNPATETYFAPAEQSPTLCVYNDKYNITSGDVGNCSPGLRMTAIN